MAECSESEVQSKRKTSEESGWTLILSKLIEKGHSFSEIKGYSIDLILLFHANILAEERRERLAFSTDVRAAVWGDKDGYKEYHTDLVKEVKECLKFALK